MKALKNITLLILLFIAFCSSKKLSSNSNALEDLEEKTNTIVDLKNGGVDNPDDCMEPEFTNAAKVEEFLDNFKNYDKDEDKLKSIQTLLSIMKGKVLSPSSTIDLFKNLKMRKYLENVLNSLKKYLFLHSSLLAEIIRNEKNLRNRGLFLDALFPVLIDHDREALMEIKDYLDCPDKTKIDEYLLIYKPMNCLMDLSQENIVFIFDLSGSMTDVFNNKGKKISRINFLKKIFLEAFQNLKQNQKYQIITFSTSATFLNPQNTKMIQATDENKYPTINEVKSLKAGGWTNISGAIELAMNIDSKIDQIYLFTDGAPTKGITTTTGLSNFIDQKFTQREQKNLNLPPINVNLLMLGGDEKEDERKLAKDFTILTAYKTMGVVKNFDDLVTPEVNVKTKTIVTTVKHTTQNIPTNLAFDNAYLSGLSNFNY